MSDNVKSYNLKSSVPNKLLQDDGTITDITGKEVTSMVKEYQHEPALPNKFLNADGTYSTLNEIISSMVDTTIFVPVDSLDSVTNPDSEKIYLVPNDDGYFDEYFYNSNNQWDKVGELKVDLSNYSTTEQVQEMINNEDTVLKQYVDDSIKTSITDVLGGEY